MLGRRFRSHLPPIRLLIPFLVLSLIGFAVLAPRFRRIERLRFGAAEDLVTPFECSDSTERTERIDATKRLTAYNGTSGWKVEKRILIVGDGNPKGATAKHVDRIVDFFEHFRVPIRVESLRSDEDALLELESGVGRFGLIVFSSAALFDSLSPTVRLSLLNYAASHRIGLIGFLWEAGVSHKNGNVPKFSNFRFHSDSGVPMVARADRLFHMDAEDAAEWIPLDGESPAVAEAGRSRLRPEGRTVLSAQTTDGETQRLILHQLVEERAEMITIGCGLTNWAAMIGMLDSVGYFMGEDFVGGVDRFIQIDIDDVFVAQQGTRLVESDVYSLIRTQNQWRQHLVEDFSFTLGFSGFYVGHGTEAETAGDATMLAEAANFQWFPHMWKHNHAHEYSLENLTALMEANRQFAEVHNLNTSLHYAVAPQHTGVYPMHEPLYSAWRKVWNIEYTSTEEYPHFAPPSRRRGFQHSNVSVLPRQTCGLFTHTMFFHAMPNGLEAHRRQIEGGSIFTSVLLNPFNIFMTHQQNFGNDRLGTFTFESLFAFIKCHTQLRLRWITPQQMASRFFIRYPAERKLLHTDVCADRRHKAALSPNSTICVDEKRKPLPNLLIVGPQKTGTTALRQFLLLHPNVHSNAEIPHFFEEPQFFGLNYDKGVEWYRSLYQHNLSSQPAVIMDKSANYFDNSEVPARSAALVPSAKIVVILMDPVERAYSWFQHARAHNESAALRYTAEQLFAQNASLAADALRLRNRCLRPGFYALHLERWLDFFPADHLVVVDSRELREEPAMVLESMQRRLGLRKRLDFGRLLKFDAAKGFFCVEGPPRRCLGMSKGRKYPPISADLRSIIQRHFTEPNNALKRWLQRYDFQLPYFLRASEI